MFATLNHVAALDLSKDGRKELPLNGEPKKKTHHFYHIMTALIKKKNITDICAMDLVYIICAKH